MYSSEARGLSVK